MMNGGMIDHKILPRFQFAGPFGVPKRVQPQRFDSFQSTKTQAANLNSRIKAEDFIRRKKAAEDAYLANPNQAAIRPGEERGIVSKAVAIAANPMTAASYLVKGQRIPDYFDRGSTNNYDIATSIVNPINAISDLNNAAGDFNTGNYLSAGINLGSGLTSLPSVPAWTRQVTDPKLRYALKETLKQPIPINSRAANFAEILALASADGVAPMITRTPGLNNIYKKLAYSIGQKSSGNHSLSASNVLRNAFGKKKTSRYTGADYAGIGSRESGSRDLLRQYIYGDSPGFEPSDLQPRGLNKYYDKYGNMSVYKLDSEIPDGKLVEVDFNDNFRNRASDAVEKIGGPSIAQKQGVSFGIEQAHLNPIKPNDDIAGHMVYLDGDPENNLKLTTQDIWKFTPEDYVKRYGNVNSDGLMDPEHYRTYLQAKLMERAGKPFILMQENPLKFVKKKTPSFDVDADMYGITDEDILKSVQGMKIIEKRRGGPIVSPRGQWDYPGQRTIVPTPNGRITMKGVPYPVYGQDETGYGQMMMPGGEYTFPGQMVDEIPVMQRGGGLPSPLYVSDRNDPRLKLYSDSLSLYNQSLKTKNLKDSRSKEVTKEQYDKNRDWEESKPYWLFDEDQYRKDKKANRVKDFDSYMYDSRNIDSKDKFNRNVLKNFKNVQVEKKQPDGTIKIYHTEFDGELLNDYTLFDPVTGTSKFIVDGSLLSIDNPNIKPIKTTYYSYEQPMTESEFRTSKETSEFINNRLKSRSKSSKNYNNYSYGLFTNDIYKKPVQQVIYKKSIQPVEYRKPAELATLNYSRDRNIDVPNIQMTAPRLEQKQTSYMYSYPTFDDRKQNVLYFPDEQSFKKFTDERGYLNRQISPGQGQATGYLNYRYGGIPMMQKGGQNNSDYKGGSIVDYLATKGYSGSKAFRKDLAKQYGVENYDFSAKKNTELLAKLRENDEMLESFEQTMSPVSVEKINEIISRKNQNVSGNDNQTPTVEDENEKFNAFRRKMIIEMGFDPFLEGRQIGSIQSPNLSLSSNSPYYKENLLHGLQGEGSTTYTKPQPKKSITNINRKPIKTSITPLAAQQSMPIPRTNLNNIILNATQFSPLVNSNILDRGKPVYPFSPTSFSYRIPNETYTGYNRKPKSPQKSSGYNVNYFRGALTDPQVIYGMPLLMSDNYPIITEEGDLLQAAQNIDDIIGDGINTGMEYVRGLGQGLQRKWESMQDEDKRSIMTSPLPVQKRTVKNKLPVKNESNIDYGYQHLYTVPDVRQPKDSLVSFANTFDNDLGGRYYIGHKAKEVTDAGAQKEFDNVEAVAHFLRDSDILPGQKITPETWNTVKGYTFRTTSPGKTVSAGNFNNPEHYRMIYKPNPNNDGTYLARYVRNKDITEKEAKRLTDQGWQLDFTVSAQHNYSDIDWDREGPSTGYAAKSKWLPLKGKGHTFIPYKSKDGFSRYSGGSVTYLFKDPQSGKNVGVDISGSVNTIKKMGDELIKKYNLKPEELTMTYHDMGSYSAKPKAHDGKLNYDQWLNYNNYNRGFSGAPMMIPKKQNGGQLPFYQMKGEVTDKQLYDPRRVIYDNFESPRARENKVLQKILMDEEKSKNFLTPVITNAANFMQGWQDSPMYSKMLENKKGADGIKAIRQSMLNKAKSKNAWSYEDLDDEGSLGSFTPGSGRIAINKNLSDKNQRILTGIHEMSHASDAVPSGYYIPKEDVDKMFKYQNEYNKNRSFLNKLRMNPEYNSYVADPTETRARLNTIRYIGKTKNVYDPYTQSINNKQLNNIDADSLEQLRLIYSDDQIVDMLNSISMKNNQGLPFAKSGGQHGGLDRWFAEKWVDIKTGKPCGRQQGENRSYPACRPSKRVSSQTPKTASELSSSEREKFKRSKTSSERINYQHRRK